MPKGNSGVNRGSGGSGASSVGTKEKVSSNRVYEIKREITGSKDKYGQFGLRVKGQSEGFKAIYEAPAGTRFTVSYTFGGSSLYEVREGRGSQKVVQLLDKNGRYAGRSKTIRNISAVRNLFSSARSITLHGE